MIKTWTNFYPLYLHHHHFTTLPLSPILFLDLLFQNHYDGVPEEEDGHPAGHVRWSGRGAQGDLQEEAPALGEGIKVP